MVESLGFSALARCESGIRISNGSEPGSRKTVALLGAATYCYTQNTSGCEKCLCMAFCFRAEKYLITFVKSMAECLSSV